MISRIGANSVLRSLHLLVSLFFAGQSIYQTLVPTVSYLPYITACAGKKFLCMHLSRYTAQLRVSELHQACLPMALLVLLVHFPLLPSASVPLSLSDPRVVINPPCEFVLHLASALTATVTAST